MAFGTSNIDKVRTMVFPAGQMRQDRLAAQSGLILLSWHSSETDKFFQVYVNGKLAGITSHPAQRKLLIQYDHRHSAALEVIWVTPDDKYVDYSEQLTGFGPEPGSHAVLSFPRRGNLPLYSDAHLFWDAGGGEIDYGEPLAVQAIWAGPFDKWGWGLDSLGRGDFGYSGTGATGWGRGSFGEGEFGFDAEMLTLQSDSLPAGAYKFPVRLVDAAGNLHEGDISLVTLSIDPLPAGPGLALESYDDSKDELVLNIL